MHVVKQSKLVKFITSLLAVFALTLGGALIGITPAQAVSITGCQNASLGSAAAGNCQNSTDISLNLNPTSLTVGTLGLVSGATISEAKILNISTQLTATQCNGAGGISFSIGSAASSLGNSWTVVINSTTGVISFAGGSGAATAATYVYQVTGNCAISNYVITKTANLTLVVSDTAKTISPSDQTITGTTGTAITSSSALTGINFTGTMSYSVTSTGANALPAALSIVAATGVVSGTPSAAGTTTITITGTNGTDSATATITFIITDPAPAPTPEPEPISRKVTICHRTHSETNPYVRITVDYNAVNKKSGHQGHDEIFAGEHVFKAGIYKRAKDKDWGDIIPMDSTGLNRWQPLNWTTLGAQIYSGAVAGCPSYDPVKYYNAMREIGVPEKKLKQEMADIEAELKEGNPGTSRVDPTTLKYTGSNANVAEQENDKVTICHRTNSTTNPYRRITVSSSSITNKSGHMGHDEIYDGHHVFDSTVTYPNNKKDWGDIIPADPTGKNRWQPLNWTTLGQDIYNGKVAGCVEKSTQEIYNELRESGESKKDVIKDLEEQQSVDDDPKDVDEVEYTGTDPEVKKTEPTTPVDPQPNRVDQSLSGIVWLDLNRDGLKDPNEPFMKNIQLSVVQLTSVTPSNLKGVRIMNLRTTAGIRPAAVVTVLTDANGYYVFPSLGAGDWKVVTGVPADLSVTYDSESLSDGEIIATVPVASHAYTWVGLVGEDTVNEKYLEEIIKENPNAVPFNELPTALQKKITEEKAKQEAKAKANKKSEANPAKGLALTGGNELFILLAGVMILFSGLVLLLVVQTKRRNARY